MTDFNEAVATVAEVKDRNLRTVIVGKVKAVVRSLIGERDVQFESGIGKRTGGVESADGIVPSAPMLSMAGGGFSIYMPSLPMDEAVGLVCDRSIARWRLAKIPGQAPTFDRQHHDLTDTMLLPFSFTLPTGGPMLGGPDMIMSSPSGEFLKVGFADGAVTITKNSATPTLVATIAMDAAGSVTITVPTGQRVLGGDNLAEALVKFQAWDTAMTAMLTAGGAVAPTPMAGTNGALAFQAAKIAYDAAKTPAQTTKLMGT
jgi:hypothetical protein